MTIEGYTLTFFVTNMMS